MGVAKPDIVQVVQDSGVVLHRRGRDYWAVCPFHGDKNPSLKINADRQSFYCFGCQAHGDVIDFTQQLQGLSYPNALKRLGIHRGRPCRPDPTIERRRRNRAKFETWRRTYYNVLADQSISLHRLRIIAKVTPPQGEVGWAYAEAVSRLPEIDYKLDLLSGRDEGKFLLYQEVKCHSI